MAWDTQVFEAALEDFEVEDEVDFEFGLPLNTVEGHLPWKGRIQQLAVDVSGS